MKRMSSMKRAVLAFVVGLVVFAVTMVAALQYTPAPVPTHHGTDPCYDLGKGAAIPGCYPTVGYSPEPVSPASAQR